MIEQMELYDYFDKVVWNKPLRLCELYGGIGSQHKALTNLGIDIKEHYLVEVDINATISYAAIHCDLNNHMDDEVPSKEDMIAHLRQFNFWSNEKPYDVAKLKGDKLKTLYLAQRLSNNLGDVYQLDDLPAVDMITWSTPCQDFSNAGLKRGFDGAKGGLTFITLELFRKLSHKPTFLLFENVPMIVSELFREGFERMLQELNELGYENVVMKLNAKHYGIPQNRDRVFVLSIRKDYHANYSTPKAVPLKLRLKDMLQEEVDDKYYLSDKMLEYMTSSSSSGGFDRGDRFNPHDESSDYAFAVTTNAGNRPTDNFIQINNTIRKLTPLETWRLMGFTDHDFAKAERHHSNSALYKQAGNSIVVQVLEHILKGLFYESVTI